MQINAQREEQRRKIGEREKDRGSKEKVKPRGR